ncbi:UNVERIFIED_CONTAM: protein SABRE [Sesamum angustifolium]|uniref:Protein SABRE n=1 Tax=Sesamum angustifolium TaxID=2727405 RepID=A0AAW2KR21_9LAMI
MRSGGRLEIGEDWQADLVEKWGLLRPSSCSDSCLSPSYYGLYSYDVFAVLLFGKVRKMGMPNQWDGSGFAGFIFLEFSKYYWEMPFGSFGSIRGVTSCFGILGYVLTNRFASRLLARILSRVMGASVGFRVGGWKCLRDIVVKFNKGAIESISVGEIRLSLRQSLVKLGVGFISRDPKLQVVICDLEVVIRSSQKSTHKSTQKSTQKTKSKKSRSSGRGKWMVLANMARFLSISLTDLVLKTPKATLDIKELRVDISKDGGPEAALFVKLLLFPINVHLVESRVTSDQSVSSGGSLSANQLHGGACAPFSCEEFSLLCELGHNREAGIVIRNLDVTFGEVHVNLNEDLLLKKKGLSETSSSPASVVPADKESGSAEKPQGKQKLAAISKFTSIFPEKAAFTLPKLDVTVAHRGYGLMLENNIMGVQLKLMKSRSVEDVGKCKA